MPPKKLSFRTGNFDVFEQLHDLIQNGKSKINILEIAESIITNVTQLEILYTKILSSVSNNKIIPLYNSAIEKGLGKLVDALEIKGLKNDDLIYCIFIYTTYLKLLLENTSKVTNDEYVKHNTSTNFSFINRKEKIGLLEEQQAKYEEEKTPCDLLLDNFKKDIGFERNSKKLLVFSDHFVANYIFWDFKAHEFSISESKFFFDIKIIVADDDKNVSELLYPVYIISAALEKIQNVKTSLIKIRKGSLITHLFAWADDTLAKEEVKSVFEKAQALVFNESSDKFDTLEKEIDKQIKDVKKKKAWAKRKDPFVHELKKLKLIQERIKTIKQVSELLKEAFLETGTITLEINGYPFIQIVNGMMYVSEGDINKITE
jgi:hypothetical protein